MNRLLLGIAILLLSACTEAEVDWWADAVDQYYVPPITTSCNTHGSRTTCSTW
jgi:hypothetical protein